MTLKFTQTATLLVTTITTGLMAGLFFVFACAVMPALGNSSDRTFIEAMQNINKSIINGWFMLPFVGTLPLLVLALVLAWRGHGRPALPWIIAGLVLYAMAFLITSGVNVPLNDRLERAGDPGRIADLDAVRRQFEDTWVAWNIVRAVVHTAAFACLAWALVVYGTHRDDVRAAGERSASRGVTAYHPSGHPSGPQATGRPPAAPTFR